MVAHIYCILVSMDAEVGTNILVSMDAEVGIKIFVTMDAEIFVTLESVVAQIYL